MVSVYPLSFVVTFSFVGSKGRSKYREARNIKYVVLLFVREALSISSDTQWLPIAGASVMSVWYVFTKYSGVGVDVRPRESSRMNCAHVLVTYILKLE